MKKLLRVIVDVCAYYLERARLKKFLHARGTSYAVHHRDEWRQYGRDNWASRYFHRSVR